MEKSLEELALFECLPPGIIEKYALQIIDRLDDDFVKRNRDKLLDKINTKLGKYVMYIKVLDKDPDDNFSIIKIFIVQHLHASDVIEICWRFIEQSNDKWDTLDWTSLLSISKNEALYSEFSRISQTISKKDPLFTAVCDFFAGDYPPGFTIGDMDEVFNVWIGDKKYEITITETQNGYCYWIDDLIDDDTGLCTAMVNKQKLLESIFS